MSKQWQELKATITELRDNGGNGTQKDVCKFLVNLMDKLEKQSVLGGDWIPLTERPMTEEERKEYKGMTGIAGSVVLDCPLPKDGEKVVVLYNNDIYIDTFHEDEGVCDFEGAEIGEVIAWMPLPPNYKKKSEDKT